MVECLPPMPKALGSIAKNKAGLPTVRAGGYSTYLPIIALYTSLWLMRQAEHFTLVLSPQGLFSDYYTEAGRLQIMPILQTDH